MIPYTADVLLALLENLNRAVWPGPVLAPALGLVVVFLLMRPLPGAGRVAAALLAAGWAWVGWAYFLQRLAGLDFMAPVYAGAFLAEAALLAWTGVVRGRLVAGFAGGVAGWAGVILALFALAGYPLLGELTGRGWPAAPIAGLAPGPTALFTLGILAMMPGRPLRLLAVIPCLWVLGGGAIAWILGLAPEAVALIAGGTVFLVLMSRGRRYDD